MSVFSAPSGQIVDAFRRRRRQRPLFGLPPILNTAITQSAPGEGTIPPAFRPTPAPNFQTPPEPEIDEALFDPVTNRSAIQAAQGRNRELAAAALLRERRRTPFLGTNVPDVFRSPNAGSLINLLQLAAQTPGFNVPLGTGPFVADVPLFSIGGGGGQVARAPARGQSPTGSAGRAGQLAQGIFNPGFATLTSMARLRGAPQIARPPTSPLRT
jgi:hypothetical protein